MLNSRILTRALLTVGLAGTFLSTAITAAALLALGLIGIASIRRGTLSDRGWERPKELRLIHFAFWLFALVGVVNWATSGGSQAPYSVLFSDLSLLLFWPVTMALTATGLGTRPVFVAFLVAGVIGSASFLIDGSVGPEVAGFANAQQPSLLTAGGMMGVVAWLVLLGIPLAVFGRQLRSGNHSVVRLAWAGCGLGAVTILAVIFSDFPSQRSPILAFYLLAVAAVASALFHELSASWTRKKTVSLSATIITKNEEDHIADCLVSVRQIADEIIVLDSGSTDNTVEIAKQYADHVEVTDWPGFGIQKQRALEKATGDWVLSIDADERIAPELAREIEHVLAEPDADAYKLPWAVTLYGSRLDFGRSGRAPLRLFRKDGVRFSDAMVHEKILIPEDRKTRTLRGRLTHYTHRNFGHALEKSAKYAWLGSQEKFRRGKRTRTLIYPTFRGLLTFLQVYFIRFGFLDGSVGFLVAVTYAQGSFNKYAGLWTLTRTEAQANQ